MSQLSEGIGSIPWIARNLLDAVPAGVALVHGPEFRFAYANEAYRRLAGGRDVVGSTYAEVWPEQAVAVLPLLERARASGLLVEERDREIRLRRRPDAPAEQAWLSCSFQPFGIPGEQSGIAIHVVDRTGEVLAGRREVELAGEREKVLAAELVAQATRTAHRLAEQAAEEARARAAELDAVIESIADGLVLYDPDGHVVRMNAAAERLLGYDDAERSLPPGERLSRLELSGARGEPMGVADFPTTRAVAGEVVRGVEVRIARRDGHGRPFWAAVSAAPIRAADGELAGVVTILSDITRLRDLQEQREDLIRAISHDLRTPLTVINTQAQLLARKPDDRPTVLRRAEALRTSAQRMAAMIDDLVEVVRLEAGQVRLSPRAVSLAPFAAELRDRLRGAVAVERLRLEVPEALPPALADPPRLERILVNLITNALKYSPPDAEATLEAAPAPGGALRLTVRDRGPGIPADELNRIFERFYRSPHSLKAEGLGLGLYITKLLVEAHGGQIRAESALGQGSAFHVTLPHAAA